MRLRSIVSFAAALRPGATALLVALCVLLPGGVRAKDAATPDYAQVHAVFKERCFDCHASQEPEASLVLETYESAMKGGENGAVIMPGNSSDSRLIKFLEGRSGVKGKNQFMPPGKEKKLTPDQIALIRAWIDGGAKPPAQSIASRELIVPNVQPLVTPRRPIKALAYDAPQQVFAVARYGEVEIYSAATHQLLRTVPGHRGSVNAVAFSKDGKYLFAGAGVTAVFGEIRQWDAATGKLIRVYEGHLDAVYSLAVSPDGSKLASGSYDQKIILWDTATGNKIRTLSGHNGCIFDLDFRPDGQILASASADRTVKLWDVATGARRDTLNQSLKEIFTVAFSPDGLRLAAGGVDNRIRVWSISKLAAETTNPLQYSVFAHEGAILKLAYSPDGKFILSSADDKTVKIWDATAVTEHLVFEKQPDWAPALAWMNGGKMIVLGRLDGTLGLYDATTGKPLSSATQQLSQAKP